LLIYLSIVDILLHGVVGDEPIHKTASSLSITIDSTHGLTVVAWVPRRIKYHHTTCSNQVDTQASGPAHRQHSQSASTLHGDNTVGQIKLSHAVHLANIINLYIILRHIVNKCCMHL